MLDADFQVAGAWRLRLAVHRLSRECAARSVVQCPKGIKVCDPRLPPCLPVALS